MVPKAFVRQYAVSQQIDEAIADQEIVLHYALALLNEIGLIGPGKDVAASGPLLFGRHRAAQVRVRQHWTFLPGHRPRCHGAPELRKRNQRRPRQPQPLPRGDARDRHLPPLRGRQLQRHDRLRTRERRRTLRAPDQLPPRSDPRTTSTRTRPSDLPQARRMRHPSCSDSIPTR